jgi:bifunctional DNA-binding transcriptional regulator/antitoxin component of YhaV-PrlF toxin-antitoxin module
MIAQSKITKKNQTTIPKAILRVLGATPGSELLYEVEDGVVRLRVRSGRLSDLTGKFAHFGKHPKNVLPVDKMSLAVAEAAAEDYANKFGRPKARRGVK